MAFRVFKIAQISKTGFSIFAEVICFLEDPCSSNLYYSRVNCITKNGEKTSSLP